jgi:phage major head subunit gpT-like protein
MPLLTLPNILTTEDRLSKEFNNDYEEALASAWYEPFMMMRQSTGKKEVLKWLLTTANIYESPEGSLRFDDLVTQDQEIENKDHGVGLQIQANQYKDDEFEFAGDWAAQVGASSALYPQKLLLQLLGLGETRSGYDGVPFFSGSHPVNPYNIGGPTYSNLLTASPLSATTFNSAVSRLQAFSMPNGESRALQPAYLLVGPNLRKAAMELLHASFIGATDNIFKDYNVQPVVAPQIAGDDWYVTAKINSRRAPFIYQEREPFLMTSYDGATQRELNVAKSMEWHLRGRMVAEFGHPFMAVKAKAA